MNQPPYGGSGKIRPPCASGLNFFLEKIPPPPPQKRLTHIQIFLHEEYEAINGDRMTYACGVWHESLKCLGRQIVQILSRNFGMLKKLQL